MNNIYKERQKFLVKLTERDFQKLHPFVINVPLLFLIFFFLEIEAKGEGNSDQQPYFKWAESQLPIPPGDTHQPGLAGAFSGLSNDVLIIAGGANFPDNPPWEGGKKVWNDQIYVLSKQGNSYGWLTQLATFSSQNSYFQQI